MHGWCVSGHVVQASFVGASQLFVLDTSPKYIDWEGRRRRCTGTWQSKTQNWSTGVNCHEIGFSIHTHENLSLKVKMSWENHKLFIHRILISIFPKFLPPVTVNIWYIYYCFPSFNGLALPEISELMTVWKSLLKKDHIARVTKTSQWCKR